MPKKETDEVSFVDVFTDVRRSKLKNGFLRQINSTIDWRPIRTLLNSKYTKHQNAVGNPAYDALMLFKILLLMRWYNLSDYAVEERINDSFSFSEFLGLSLELPSPDHSTICRFRNEIGRLGLYEKLLKTFNKQLKKHGIMEVKEGVIVDASVVSSPYEPNGLWSIEVAGDREDLRSEEAKQQEEAYHYELKCSKPGVDNEARWTKKQGRYQYGYKMHTATDMNGLVVGVISTAANVSDTVQFQPLLDKLSLPPNTPVLADKGYASQSNSRYLLERQLVDGILLKGSRGRPLTDRQKAFNRALSRSRSVIERTFGSIRLWFGGGVCRYRGLEKTANQILLDAMAYNLKRMPGLIMSKVVR